MLKYEPVVPSLQESLWYPPDLVAMMNPPERNKTEPCYMNSYTPLTLASYVVDH